MMREIKYLTKHLPDLRAGRKVIYRGHVYRSSCLWESDGNHGLRVASESICRHSIGEKNRGYKYGEVHDDKVFRTED